MKRVHGSAVLKSFESETWTSFNYVNFPEHKANYTVGDVTHKSWYLRGAESFMFSQQLARKRKKKSTIKGQFLS